MQSQAKSFAAKVKRFLDLSPFSIPFLCSPGLLNLTNDCILMPSTYKIDFYSGALVLVDLVSGTIFSYIFTYLVFFFFLYVSTQMFTAQKGLLVICRPRKFLPASHSYCLSETLFCDLLSKPMFACRLVLYCLPKLGQLSLRVASSILSSDMHDL